MDKPFPAYQGDEPKIFVCYAHDDADLVYPELQRLHDDGFRIWYDEGISVGESWSQEIANALDSVSHLVFFATHNSVNSRHCLNEIQYALGHGKPLVVIHLEELQMPGGMELALGASQALMKYQFADAEYEEKLRSALTRTPTAALTVPKAKSARPWVIPVAVVLLAGLVSIALNLPSDEPSQGSFAVLPFKNYSGIEQEYLADGLTDGLIAQLSKLQNVYVTSRASSFALKQDLRQGSIDMRGIRERLRVRYVIDGSVRASESASGLLVSVQIIDTGGDTNLWAGEWDTSADTIMRIQGQVAAEVGRIVSPESDAQDTALIVSPATESATAYDKYLQGLNALRQPATPEHYAAAEAQLTEAVSLDPQFAQAYAALCEVYLGNYRGSREPIKFVLAQKACNQALQIDPELWEVSLSLGRLYRISGDLPRALMALDRAATLNATDAGIMIQRGWTLNELGRQTEAESSFVKAVSLEPGYWRTYTSLAGYYYTRVQYDKALTVYQQASDLVTDDSGLRHDIATVQLAQGDYQSAAHTYHELIDRAATPSTTSLTNLGTTYYYMGCYEEAATFQKRAVQMAPSKHSTMGRLAESCRLVEGGQAFAVDAWTRAAELAEAEPNQASWDTKGLLAVYQAHIGQAEQAALNIEAMWQLNPERSTANFYAAIVAMKAGDEDAARAAQTASLAQGFPAAMMHRDPDLNGPLDCQLPQRLEYVATTCQLP